VLLAGPDRQELHDEAERARTALGVTVDAYRIGDHGELGDPQRAFCPACDLSAAGAVLVRPDGFIAWRSRTAGGDPARALVEVLK
jgi:putative polyketide hydroxylase